MEQLCLGAGCSASRRKRVIGQGLHTGWAKHQCIYMHLVMPEVPCLLPRRPVRQVSCACAMTGTAHLRSHLRPFLSVPSEFPLPCLRKYTDSCQSPSLQASAPILTSSACSDLVNSSCISMFCNLISKPHSPAPCCLFSGSKIPIQGNNTSLEFKQVLATLERRTLIMRPP